ncbi:MAG: hypothetical protein KBT06_11975 [Prevotellaceae bacterium]|nr:hypothetical protein [Candidatus Colivivens equi]
MESIRRNVFVTYEMETSDNRSHIFDTIISCLLHALSSFTRRKYFATYFTDVILHLMQYNPDLSPNPVVGDESGIIKLSNL